MKNQSTRSLKITTITENSATGSCLGQWGLSFLLELIDAKSDKRKVVFDSGIDKRALLQNIKRLKIDLSDLDCVVLSHGHLDHTAATVEVVKAAGGVRVYAHPYTFLQRFHLDRTGKRRNGGVPQREGLADIERVGGTVSLNLRPTEIVPGLWTTGEIERATSFERPLPLSENEKLIIVVGGKETDDQILDDLALWTQVKGAGPYVITGCAHAGIVNTLTHVQKLGCFPEIYGVVGGTHLVGRSEEYLQQTTTSLKQFGLELISACHCTGFKAMTRLWNAFPREFVLNFSGRVIENGKEPTPRVT
jgi:7,8-dihydropterin-6-yl-methyl-4-(beta-D-ribofuranosyl)aminobenzene 5'-phosphate synthase